MTRWRAFCVHLFISLLVIGSIAFGLFSLWYPPELLGFAKADRLFLIIAMVDVVVGPLLTLIVFKPGKPSLKFDLGVIALLQAVFLVAGLWTVWTSRPVFLVGAGKYFEIVFANQIDPEDLAEGALGFTELPAFGARLVGLSEEGLGTFQFGRPRSAQPRLYQDFNASVERLRGFARGPDRLTELDAFLDLGGLKKLQQDLAARPEARYMPIISARGDALLEVDPQTMRPLRFIAVPPGSSATSAVASEERAAGPAASGD